MLEVLVAIIALVSLQIAVASYEDAQKSGTEQLKALESARKALEVATGIAGKQQTLLEKNLNTAEAHLALVQKQREEEMKRLAMKPAVVLGLDPMTPKELRARKEISIKVDKNDAVKLDFVVTNTGEVSVRKVLVLVVANPSSVVLHERGNYRPKDSPNVIQFSGQNLLELFPYAINDAPYRFPVDAIVSRDLSQFNVQFRIMGENLKVSSTISALWL